jgi:hypothetical protein
MTACRSFRSYWSTFVVLLCPGMRAIRARYDPYKQVKGRVDQLKSLGHSVDKVNKDCLGLRAIGVGAHVGRIYLDGRHVHVAAAVVSRLFRAQSAR